MKKTFLSIIFLLILLLLPTMVFATEAASLPDAVNGVITLTEDIVLEDTVVIDSTVTLDLNGHTISNTKDIWNTTTASYALISVGEGGNLTIRGEGTLQAKENDCFAVMVRDGGKLTIDSGKYVGNIHSIYIIDEGEVVINGGEYSIQQLSPDVETDKYRYTLNCRDEYYVAGKAKFTVTGGKFYNFNPENNLSEGEGTNYLAEGYKVVQNGNYYEVVVDEEYNFKKALSNGGTVKLDKDIVLEDTVVINSTVTLDLNGHTISNTKDIWNTTTASYALISVGEGGNLTIRGEGTLQAKENDCFAVMVQDGGKLTINSGKYVGNISSVYIISEGEVVINGGEYSIQQLSPDVETDKYRYTLNCRDEYYVAGKAKFTVTGGKFYNFNPENNLSEGEGTNYLAEGYKVTQNGDYYVVSKIHKHSYNSEWKCDDTNHWHECSCGEKADVAEHQLELKNVVEPSFTTAGYSGDTICKICDKLIESGKTIPALVIVENETAKVESEVLDQAINEATNKDIVELDLTKVGDTVTSVEIPSMSIEAVKESNKPLEVKTTNATLVFDNKALEEVAKRVGNTETVTLKVEKAKEETLNKEQKEAIKDKKVEMVISAELLAGDKIVSDFKGGKVTVKIPFTPENGTKGEEYKIIYIADDGSIQEIDTKYIDGNLVVELEHFSDYAIIKVAEKTPTDTTEKEDEKEDLKEDVKENEKDDTPKTGVISISAFVWVAIASIALVSIVNTKKSSKHSR